MEENKSNKTKSLSITMILLAIVIGFGFIIGFTQVTGGKYTPNSGNEYTDFYFDEEGTLLAYYGVGGDIVIPAHYSLTEPQEMEMESTSIYTLVERARDLKLKEFHITDISTYVENSWGGKEYKENYKITFEFRKAIVGNDYDVVAIAEDVFSNSGSKYTSFKLPETLKRIGRAAFATCMGITEIDIPEGVETIDSAAFFVCDNLEYVKVPDTVKYIGIQAFERCPKLKNIHIPSGINSLSYCQYSATGITEIDIPDNVSYLGEESFSKCPELARVGFNNNIYSISNNCFKNCVSLTEIVLPESLHYIYDQAFGGCTNLKTVVLNSNAVPTLSGTVFDDTVEKFYVKDELYDTYKENSKWSAYADKIFRLSEKI